MSGQMHRYVYKILTAAEWAAAQVGPFKGVPVDLHDGYIHLSTATQVRETAAKHFAGRADLWLIRYDAESLGPALRWEPSRGGALFPHLYRTLEPGEVTSAIPLPLGTGGVHEFPEDVP